MADFSKSVADLNRRRAEISEEIAVLEQQKTEMEGKLASVKSKLEEKLTDRAEFDKVIGQFQQVGCKSPHYSFVYNIYFSPAVPYCPSTRPVTLFQ